MRGVRLGIALLGCAAVGAVHGAPLYRWIDEQGQVHYTDRPPPDRERQRVGPGGPTAKPSGGASDPQQARADGQAKAEAQRLAAEQAARDRLLLESYGDERELIRARDNRLAALTGTIERARERVEALSARLEALLAQREAGAPSEALASVQDLERQLAANRSFLEARERERAETAARFDADLLRMRELAAGRY
jgi:hypothetical protein